MRGSHGWAERTPTNPGRILKKKNDALPQRKTLQLDTARITEAYFNFQQQSIHLQVAMAMKLLVT